MDDRSRGDRRIGRDRDDDRNAAWRRQLRERRDAIYRNRNTVAERRLRADRRRWRDEDRAGRLDVVRRTITFWLRQRRIRNRDGRFAYARSRRFWVRDQRFRNRYRNGRSIYWLPPVGAAIAVGAYVIASRNASYDDYVDTFMAPPVRRVDRHYTLDEVVSDPEIRSAMRSIDLDSISFASGSDEIPDDQINRLSDVAEAIKATLSRRPDEKFLIEGHTDTVGDAEANLELSENRARAVQEVLVSEFGIPAENLEAVGYGEQYLLVDYDGAEQRNRRVVVRAIGSLLARN